MKNRKIKILINLILVIFIFSSFLYADILVKVGVIDKDKIYETYKNKPLVDIKKEYLIDSYNEKALEYKKQIDELKAKLQSTDLTDEEIQNIKDQIKELYGEVKNYYDYVNKKVNDYEVNREKYIEDDINYAIRKVAEREGYSIIFDIHADFLIYYSETVDLTELVLQYLQDYIIKYCNENNIDVDKYVFNKTDEIQSENQQSDQNSNNN